MAYSSIEHMGVVALGFGFGGSLGVAGALYHMLNHSLNKSLMFFGAGNMMRAYGTKEILKITGVGRYFPRIGALWLAGAIAITGAPPFGLFMSEFTIMRAGLKPSFSWAVYVMLVLLIVIFIGFMNHFRTMYYRAPIEDVHGPAGRSMAGASCPHVACARSSPHFRTVVAGGYLELFGVDRAGALAGPAMNGVELIDIDQARLADAVDRPHRRGRSHADGLRVVSDAGAN